MVKYKDNILLLLFVLMLIVVGAAFFGKTKEMPGFFELADGWDVTFNGEEIPGSRSTALTDISFRETGPGDHFELETVIPVFPEDITGDPVLRLTTYNAVVTVFLDGRQIYSYGEKNREAGRLVGKGYLYVQLDRQDAGKRLSVTMDATEHFSFRRFDPVFIGSYDTLISYELHKNWMFVFVSIFFLVIGILLLISCAVQDDIRNRWIKQIFWLGIYTLNMGIWCGAYSRCLQLFCPDLSLNLVIELFSFYFIMVPVLFLIKGVLREDKTAVRLLDVVIGINLLLFLTAIVVHSLNIIHAPAMLRGSHVLLVISMTVLAFSIVISVKHGIKPDKYLFAGIFIMIAAAGSSLILFYLKRSGVVAFTPDIVPLGLFGFGVCFFLRMIYGVRQKIYEDMEKQMLERRANIDTLTNICNRAKCEEELEKLSAGDNAYGIISFDLNELKRINDTLGHMYGDRLISGFGAMLSEVFSDAGTVGRMGGDEFIAILPGISREDIDKRLERLKMRMEEESARDEVLNFSSAWGVAMCSEGSGESAMDVYKRADMLMYEMKRDMKGIYSKRNK